MNRRCITGVIVLFLALSAPVFADAPSLEHANAAYVKGDSAAALAEVEEILAKNPNEPNALLFSARFNFDMGNLDAARGRAERMVKLSGSNATAWELMLWITQAQGDLPRRDEALSRLKIAIGSAIDPEVRRRQMLLRDRITGNGHVVVAADYFERAGYDFIRYQFTSIEPRRDPQHGLLLRTDTATTDMWSSAALLPPSKRLFHLDLVEVMPDGDDNVTIYQYYVDEPGYDVVRAKVMEILRGEAKPISGTPKSLAGILKQP